MLFCTLAGYAFAKHQFPYKGLLFALLLSTMLIPGAVLLVPGFLLIRDLGWINSFLALIVPHLSSRSASSWRGSSSRRSRTT